MQATLPQPAITVTDLACRRGDRLLFRGLHFAVGPGEALHLAGPNGIGKSSLIRMLAGLLRPFAGTVTREGTIALLDERPALDPYLPLGKALDFWSRLDGAQSAHAGEISERLGLTHLLDVPVRYLSTGQTKRAALARLAGQQANTWLLDEPLNGLDRNAVATVEALVADHCAAGGTAIIASHQPFMLAELARFELERYAP
ncbi:heme ABC exporter, ATP-binding protein CcmA [Croceicoccus estronivorus]|uniref:heme ABC exporter ATP-binding protein CcmA n=1 Tax=Croceicoccus estronivorus TaxID=1172626 RepID=UPI0008336412|nr:heme ABC exporter ATP-binding protein CcmA [Croceicoccus estronivorus]OCC25212.1 heme ABC exporter, ATP-binding protein CcmA [Croceicoccus estronivorus]